MNSLNSALRLYQLLTKARAVPDDRPAMELWAKVFNLPEPDGQPRTFRVIERLVWVDDELECMIRSLKIERGYPEEGYLHVQRGIRNALMPHALVNKAVHVKQHLSPEVMASLFQMSLNLERSEEAISDEELNALEVLVEDWRKRLDSSILTDVMKNILARHIRLLRRALDAYPIWGIRAFSDSLRDAAGDLIALQNRASSDTGSQEEKDFFSSLKAVWGKVTVVVNEADKVRKIVALAGPAMQALRWLSDKMQ